MNSVRALLKVILLLALAIEISIRLLGFTDNYSRHAKAKKQAEEKTPNVRRILVLGSSFTMGVGAAPGESYPEFLQQNLDRDYPGRFQVVNGGVGNANVSYVLEHLDEDLKKYNPDLVVAMIGLPNNWNYYGYDRYLKNKERSVPAWLRLQSLLHYSALFRLLTSAQLPPLETFRQTTADPSAMFPEISKSETKKLTLKWIAYAHGRPLRTLSQAQLEEAESVLKSAFEQSEYKSSLALLVMYVLHVRGKREESFEWLEKSIKSNPNDKRLGLARIRRRVVKNFDQISNEMGTDFAKKFRVRVSRLGPETQLESELAEWFVNGVFPKKKMNSPEQSKTFLRQAILADPLQISSYTALINLLIFQKNLNEAVETEISALRRNPFDNSINTVIIRAPLEGQLYERHLSAINEYKSLFSEQESIVKSPEKDSILEWTAHDLALFCQKIKAYGIPVVLQTFPPLKSSGLPVETEKAVRKVAAQYDVPLSDTYSELQRLFTQNNKMNYYSGNAGSDDPHLNGAGYKAVADILLLTLEQQGLLDKMK